MKKPRPLSRSILSARLLVPALAVCAAASLQAQVTYTWSGGGADNNWTTSANWTGGIAPSDAAAAPENIIRFDLNSLARLDTGVFNVASGFDLSQIIVADVNNGAPGTTPIVLRPTSNTNITLDLIPNGSNPAIDLSAATQDLTFVANGTGIPTINFGANTHTVTVASGRTLSLLTATGSTANTVTIGGGGKVILGGNSENTNLRINITGPNTVVELNKNSTSANRAISGNATSTIGAGATLRLTGTGNDQISRQHDLVVDGTLDLNGKFEGIDALSSSSGVSTGLITSSAPGVVLLRISEDSTSGVFGGVIQDGAATVSLVRAHAGAAGVQSFAGTNTYTGSTVLSRGTIQLLGTAGALSGTTSVEIDASGTLSLDNRGTAGGFAAAVHLNRLNDAATISLASGTINLLGVSTADATETLGPITLNPGHNVIRLSSDTVAGTTATGITAASIDRAHGGTLTLVADNVFGLDTATTDDVGYFRLTSAPTAAQLSGAGSTGVNRDILIGGYGSFSATTANGGELLTPETTGGFTYLRPLAAAEYGTVVAGSFDERNANVGAAQTLTASAAVNSLKMSAGPLTISPGKTLFLGGHAADSVSPTVTEGSGTLSLAGGGINGMGNLDFGSREIIIRNTAATAIDARIIGTNGLTKTGTTTLALNTANTITGTTRVNDGDLTIRNNHALGTAPSDIIVTSGATNSRLVLEAGVNIPTNKTAILSVSGANTNTLYTALRSGTLNNTWAGNILINSVGNGANPALDSQIQVGTNSTLNLTGDIYAAGILPDTTYTADANATRRFSTSNSAAGVINFLGQIRDVEIGASPSIVVERLRMTINGNAAINANIHQPVLASGLLHGQAGFLRYKGTGNFYDPDTQPTTSNMIFEPTGTASQFALLLTQPGQTFYRRVAAGTAEMGISNANNSTANNVLFGGENETGTVEFGNGNQVIDFNPRTSDDSGTAGALDQFRDLRLYARPGGEVIFRTNFTDDTGEASTVVTTNEVGAITKVGPGTVRLAGRGTGSNVDGGIYNLGGTLLLDYTTNLNARVHSTIDGAQYTAAGGDLVLEKTNAGAAFVERMSGNFTARSGQSEIAINAATGSNLTLRLATAASSTINAGTAAAPGAVNFVETGAGTKSVLMGLAANQNTRVGSWATYGTTLKQATDWAFINATNDLQAYVHTLGETDTFGPGLHTDLTTNPAAFSAATTSASLRINNPAVTNVDLDGQTLTLTDGGILIGSGHNQNNGITNGTIATGTSELYVHNYGTGTFVLDSNVAGAANVNLGGTGTTMLTNAKTFTGELRITGGKTVLADPLSMGTNAAFTIGATLNTTATMTISKNATILGDGATFDVDNATSTTLSGILASQGNFIFGTAGATFATVINAANVDSVGVGDINKLGTGTLTLSNVANTYQGLTDIKAGTLRIVMTDVGGNQTNLGSFESWIDGTIIRSGATLEINKAGNVNTGTSGNEFLRFEGGSNLAITGGGRFGWIGQIEINGDISVSTATGSQGDFTVNGGTIYGTGAITKTGPGTLLIGGNNTNYTGAITINEGLFASRGLGVGSGSAGAGTLTIGGTGTTAEFRRMSNGSVQNNTLPEARNIIVTGTGTKRIGGGNASVPAGDDTFAYNGTVTLNSNVEVSYTAAAGTGPRTGTFQFNNAISGTGNMTTATTGGGVGTARPVVVELNAASPTWSGSLIVGNTADNVNNPHTVRSGHDSATSAANPVTLRFNSSLQTGGRAATIGDLATTGQAGVTSTEFVENTARTDGTLTIVQNTNATWDATFRDGDPTGTRYDDAAGTAVGKLHLVKSGTGDATMTLTNTYTGSTAINQGGLIVTGSIQGSGVTVASGAKLGGTGTIDTTVINNGTLAPGTSPGDLTINGNVAFATGSTFALEIVGPGLPNHDQLTIGAAAAVTIASGSNITVALSYFPVVGDNFMVIENLGTSAIGGTFANLADAQFLVVNFSGTNYHLEADYEGGTGNDLVLTVVPEPTAAISLLGGLGLLLGLRSRRRRA